MHSRGEYVDYLDALTDSALADVAQRLRLQLDRYQKMVEDAQEKLHAEEQQQNDRKTQCYSSGHVGCSSGGRCAVHRLTLPQISHAPASLPLRLCHYTTKLINC